MPNAYGIYLTVGLLVLHVGVQGPPASIDLHSGSISFQWVHDGGPHSTIDERSSPYRVDGGVISSLMRSWGSCGVKRRRDSSPVEVCDWIIVCLVTCHG